MPIFFDSGFTYKSRYKNVFRRLKDKADKKLFLKTWFSNIFVYSLFENDICTSQKSLI
jgi:hypothetical protein